MVTPMTVAIEKNEFIFYMYLRMSGYSQVIYLYKTVKTITELILGHKDKLEIKIVVHVLQTTRNLVVAVVVFFSLMTWVLQWPTEWGFRI